MNPEQALTAVADAIARRTTSPTTHWAIVWSVNRFLCVPAKTSPLFEFTFITLPDEALNIGLNQKQWDDLIIEVGVFLTQKGFI